MVFPAHMWKTRPQTTQEPISRGGLKKVVRSVC